MFKCFSCFNPHDAEPPAVELQPIAPAPVDAKKQTLFDMEELATARAGRIKNKTEYVITEYNKSVNVIFAEAQFLKQTYELLCKNDVNVQPNLSFIMQCLAKCDDLIREINEFMRNSAYEIDEHVQARKDISVEACREAVSFRKTLGICQLDCDYPVTKAMPFMDKLMIEATKLENHFFSSFKNPPLPRRSLAQLLQMFNSGDTNLK